MEKEFCTYEQALAIKELGFDELCFGYYIETGEWVPASYSIQGTVYPSNSDLLPEWTSAPLKQQVLKFFREKYNITQNIAKDGSLAKEGIWAYTIVADMIYFDDGFKTYEAAEDVCIDKLIELTKKRK